MKVYLIAKTDIDYDAFDRFCSDEGIAEPDRFKMGLAALPAEHAVEWAGRVCYMSYGKGRTTTAEFIKNIIESGHHSVLEHANFTFLITGISRSCSHELVRHRHLSFSQQSQRYVNEEDADVVYPPAAVEPEIKAIIRTHMDEAVATYKTLVKLIEKHAEIAVTPGYKTLLRKYARQAARAVLPNATETRLAVTGNARAWREFLVLRTSHHADLEMQTLARAILDTLIGASPLLFGDLGALLSSTTV